MPFEEAEIETASVHYAYVCKKPVPKKIETMEIEDDQG